jgi:hypothetical protein
MSPLAMPLSESEFNRNVVVHTQLDSSVSSKLVWCDIVATSSLCGDHQGVCAFFDNFWTTCSCETKVVRQWLIDVVCVPCNPCCIRCPSQKWYSRVLGGTWGTRAAVTH